MRPIIGLLLAAFVSLNLISMLEVINTSRAALFISITLYCCLAVWLCSFVNSRAPRSTARGDWIRHRRHLVRDHRPRGVALPIPFRAQIYNTERAKAFFADPNVFGPFLVPAAAIMLQETIEPRLLRLAFSAFKLHIVANTADGRPLFLLAWRLDQRRRHDRDRLCRDRDPAWRRPASAGRLVVLIMIAGGLLLAVFSAVGSVQVP